MPAANDGEPAGAFQEASIAQLQAAMAAGDLTAVALVELFLARIEAIDRGGPALRSVLEVNPDALAIAGMLDRERQAGRVRGPLHGIPLLLKDNLDTADRMMTTAGSLALVGAAPMQDATVAAQLRAAGAILLGKANMSEWANFRSRTSTSGWSGRGGQTRNPHILDRNPSGSSSGSAVAVAAALCVAAIGTETDGSIVSPAGASGVVGLKPTVGLVSRAGIVPISHTQDTAGPHTRLVADAAAVLTAIAATAPDPRDPATSGAQVGIDYTRFLDPDGLVGARIGVARNLGSGASRAVDAIFERVLQVLREAGAVLVDPAEIPSDSDIAADAEREVLLYEFKADLNAYLTTRRDVALDREGLPRTLAGVIAFNEAHADQELRFFGQDRLVDAEAKGPLTEPAYGAALDTSRRLSGPEGIDRVMDEHRLDALIAPTGSPAWPIDLVNGDHAFMGSSSAAAQAGYPLLSVPAGFAFDLPVNVTFIGRRFGEPALIRLAYAFEQATMARRAPRFLPTLSIGG